MFWCTITLGLNQNYRFMIYCIYACCLMLTVCYTNHMSHTKKFNTPVLNRLSDRGGQSSVYSGTQYTKWLTQTQDFLHFIFRVGYHLGVFRCRCQIETTAEMCEHLSIVEHWKKGHMVWSIQSYPVAYSSLVSTAHACQGEC